MLPQGRHPWLQDSAVCACHRSLFYIWGQVLEALRTAGTAFPCSRALPCALWWEGCDQSQGKGRSLPRAWVPAGKGKFFGDVHCLEATQTLFRVLLETRTSSVLQGKLQGTDCVNSMEQELVNQNRTYCTKSTASRPEGWTNNRLAPEEVQGLLEWVGSQLSAWNFKVVVKVLEMVS